MVEKKVTIVNKTGIHARPADLLIKLCIKFKSKIEIIKDEKVANAKSILNILALGLNQGTKIVIRVEGEDEVVALESIVDYIQNLDE
jgi:phosphotransferase system HPr (HPr) family protein